MSVESKPNARVFVLLPGEKLTRLLPNFTSSVTNKLTREITECSSLDDVLPVQGLQNLGAAEPLEADLHVVVIPFKRLRPKNPADEEERRENASFGQKTSEGNEVES